MMLKVVGIWDDECGLDVCVCVCGGGGSLRACGSFYQGVWAGILVNVDIVNTCG